MRVLYFHQHFSTPQGSAGTRSYEMARALIAEGHEVVMVCGRYAQARTGLDGPYVKGKRRGVVEGIEVIEFDLDYGNHMGLLKRAGVFARYAIGAIEVALRERADVIFATSTPLTAGIPGIVARWLKGSRFVFEVRDLWPELPREMGVIRNPLVLAMLSVLEWASYRSAHRLIGLSPGIVQGIERRGVRPEHIAMVPNGCDLDLFASPAERWRPEGVGEDQLLAVFSGTHGNANGLGAVLDAGAVLQARRRDDIRIVLIGTGGEKDRLKARAKAEGIDTVLFLDPVPKTRLNGLLAGADIGLQVLRNVPAFYYGTSPNKFFDYIASGLPVLNNYPGWLAGLITESGCGYAVPPDDPEAFADALIAASENRAALAQMGRRARALAEARFARAALAQQWVAWVTGAARG
ncbi:MAG: glycosyltransferase family 4 protein [Brevundimonas sp.]|uniref:glycosyltransferase family 4 protein n=1 Tax=Brevundimonas sp. TaxID=1871086 RepID=UPI0039194FB5